MGKIMAVNISEKKGTQKKNVHSARLMEEFGIEKDAHAGKWHRQVSLLSYEKIEEFKAKGAPIEDGAFGENLIVSGYDLKALPVGTRLRSGEVLLEVTQMGKNVIVDVRFIKLWVTVLCQEKVFYQYFMVAY